MTALKASISTSVRITPWLVRQEIFRGVLYSDGGLCRSTAMSAFIFERLVLIPQLGVALEVTGGIPAKLCIPLRILEIS